MMTMMQTFVNAAERKFWTLRYNVDSKRVLTVGGRIGTRGCARRVDFAGRSREDVRVYVDERIETKLAKGFEQIA